MRHRIALVEDDPAIRANYTDALKKHGYEVTAYADRPGALAAMRSRLPDLVLLDIGLGDEVDGGFKLCQELRALSPTLPVIFLTARDSDIDLVSGLRMGADDYVTKSVSLPHLLARVSALFRRVELAATPAPADNIIERGPLKLDLNRFAVSWRETVIDLTLTEFWLVHALAKFPGHVKNRDQLMSEAHIVVDDSTITSHVKRIRRKFAALDPQFDCVDTVYGLGYRWKAAD
jgi:two-component system OmpR family response regulator